MPAQFDHEKLDVYQLTLQFVAWVTPLLEAVGKSGSGRIAEVSRQLDRASLSILLNIAEGNGRRASQQRARFFDDARGSGTECAACLDALVAKGIREDGDIEEGKALLVRIVAMLSKLVTRFDKGDRVREGGVEYGTIENESEDEDEDEKSAEELSDER